MRNFGFKFISGKYNGGEFPIPEQGELLIGRASDLDMVLVEDMVSRKHAMVSAQGGRVLLTDLGSTNGTYVNGEKITRRELRRGDRVLIGTSILKVIEGSELSMKESTAADKTALRHMLEDLARNAAPEGSAMSGDLEEVPLPDLLLLFATNKKTGVLTINDGFQARLYLQDGQLTNVLVGGASAMTALKALCRALAWRRGKFHFDNTAPVDAPVVFTQSTEGVLMEATRQNDELKRLLQQLPAFHSFLTLALPLRPRLADLNTQELDVLQGVLNASLGDALDHIAATDYETAVLIQGLLKRGYVAVAP